MSPKEKFLLGGTGALIPIISVIILSDASMIEKYLDTEVFSIAGYIVRYVFLFFLGAIWVYTDSSIVDRRKALEVGLAVPALLTVWISSSNLNDERAGEEFTSSGFEIISSAHAQDSPDTLPPPSPLDQFIKGLLGK